MNAAQRTELESNHGDWLVVMDHQEAKIYHGTGHGNTPERISPEDNQGHHKHLHSQHEATDGKRQPELKSYYAAIAKSLIPACRIVLFGAGTGRSNAMEHFMAYLQDHDRPIREKVVGSAIVDTHHNSESQQLSQARDLFANSDGV